MEFPKSDKMSHTSKKSFRSGKGAKELKKGTCGDRTEYLRGGIRSQGTGQGGHKSNTKSFQGPSS